MIRRVDVVVVGLMMCTGLVGGQAAVRVHGVAYDSLHGKPLGGAFISLAGTPRTAVSDSAGRFLLDSVKPGSYRLVMQHDLLDSIGVSSVTKGATVSDGRETLYLSVPPFATIWRIACRGVAPPADSGLILGTVHGADGGNVPAASVLASWADAGLGGRRLQRSTDADSAGNFALCGVPTTTQLRLQAIKDSATMGAVYLPRLGADRIARRDLSLSLALTVTMGHDTARLGSAVLTGVVLTDTTHNPIVNAQVSLSDLSIHTMTDERGEFRLPGIIPGTHDVLVRRIGYGQLDARITFAEQQTVERTIYLDRITALDSVNVTASAARDLMMESFEEHRVRGFGRFFTREDLDKRLGESMAAVMTPVQGVHVLYGHSSKAWVQGRQPLPPHCPFVPQGSGKSEVGNPGFDKVQACWRRGGWYYPEDFEVSQGMTIGCYARVYLDRTLMNTLAEPYDLNSLASTQIEAIEWYADNAQVPPEYLSRVAPCGVMIIHSRRSP